MITFENVTFRYGAQESNDTENTDSIRNLSFSVKSGECVILCGRSGSGKSTILRTISGLIPIFFEGKLSGKVLVNDRSPDTFTSHEKVEHLGVVFQDPRSQFFMDNVQNELAFSAENIGIQVDRIIRKIRETSKIFEIEGLLDRKVDALSSGQKQRVAIASATLLHPPILILDEPISNLDDDGVSNLLDLLKKIKRFGTTIIISEHRLHRFLSIADRYIHIDDGRLIHQWSSSEFQSLTGDYLLTWGIRHPELFLKFDYKKNIRKISDDSGLCIENISFQYKKGTPCLKKLSLSFPRQTVTALTGQNGVGKTTLCKIICGLLKQKTGKISLDGKEIGTNKRRTLSYMVLQDADYQLFSDTVTNEIMLGQASSKSKNNKNNVLNALNSFHLYPLRNVHPAALSGGEKQRVTLAAAQFSSAEIIILDEPTSGMDGDGVIRITEWVRTIANQNKIVIIITHDDLLIKMACDHKICLK